MGEFSPSVRADSSHRRTVVLVLTRKVQQQLVIGDQIRITVVRIKGNTVRLGIEAPRAMRVVRAELPRESEPSPPDAGPRLAAHIDGWKGTTEEEGCPTTPLVIDDHPAAERCCLAPAIG